MIREFTLIDVLAIVILSYLIGVMTGIIAESNKTRYEYGYNIVFQHPVKSTSYWTGRDLYCQELQLGSSEKFYSVCYKLIEKEKK